MILANTLQDRYHVAHPQDAEMEIQGCSLTWLGAARIWPLDCGAPSQQRFKSGPPGDLTVPQGGVKDDSLAEGPE